MATVPSGTLSPTSDDSPVRPNRGPGVAVAVEQPGTMAAQVPVPLLPAHHRGVEGRKERNPRLDVAHRLQVIGEDKSDAVCECYLDCSASGQRGPCLPDGPARPPLDIGERSGTERPQPPHNEARTSFVGVSRIQAAVQPAVGSRPAILAGDPCPSRPGSDDSTLCSQEEENPGRHSNRSAPLLTVAECQLDLEFRYDGRQLGRGCLSELVERGEGCRPDSVDPRFTVVGHVLRLDKSDQPLALSGHQCLRACRVHRGSEVSWNDEERSSHSQHAQEALVFVESPFEVGPLEFAHSSARRQKHRDRVAGVKAR